MHCGRPCIVMLIRLLYFYWIDQGLMITAPVDTDYECCRPKITMGLIGDILGSHNGYDMGILNAPAAVGLSAGWCRTLRNGRRRAVRWQQLRSWHAWPGVLPPAGALATIDDHATKWDKHTDSHVMGERTTTRVESVRGADNGVTGARAHHFGCQACRHLQMH